MKTNEKIRQLRESRQWTQEEMATKLSMSTNGYAKIERGDTRSNLDRLEQISEVFGIDIVELLAYGEDGKINLTNSPLFLYRFWRYRFKIRNSTFIAYYFS